MKQSSVVRETVLWLARGVAFKEQGTWSLGYAIMLCDVYMMRIFFLRFYLLDEKEFGWSLENKSWPILNRPIMEAWYLWRCFDGKSIMLGVEC